MLNFYLLSFWAVLKKFPIMLNSYEAQYYAHTYTAIIYATVHSYTVLLFLITSYVD